MVSVGAGGQATYGEPEPLQGTWGTAYHLDLTCCSLFWVSRMSLSTWSALACMREMSRASSWVAALWKGIEGVCGKVPSGSCQPQEGPFPSATAGGLSMSVPGMDGICSRCTLVTVICPGSERPPCPAACLPPEAGRQLPMALPEEPGWLGAQKQRHVSHPCPSCSPCEVLCQSPGDLGNQLGGGGSTMLGQGRPRGGWDALAFSSLGLSPTLLWVSWV